MFWSTDVRYTTLPRRYRNLMKNASSFIKFRIGLFLISVKDQYYKSSLEEEIS